MSREAAVLTGRQRAEAGMVDTCRIVVAGTGPPVRDEVTGGVGPPAGTVVYTGPCKIQNAQAAGTQREAGEHVFTVQDQFVHLPVAAPTVPIQSTVTITASLLDSGNVGRVFTVVALFRKTYATAQRLQVQEVTE